MSSRSYSALLEVGERQFLIISRGGKRESFPPSNEKKKTDEESVTKVKGKVNRGREFPKMNGHKGDGEEQTPLNKGHDQKTFPKAVTHKMKALKSAP